MAYCQFLFPFQRKRETRFAQFQQNFTQTRFKTFHIFRHCVTQEVARKFCAEKCYLSIIVTMPHQSEAPVRGRTGFSKIGGLLASVPSISRPSFRAACLRKIVWELFFRTGTLATQASFSWVVQFQEFVVHGNPPQKSINYIIANKTVIIRYTVVSVHFQTVDTRNLWILCELRTYKWNEGMIIAVVFAI